MKPPALPPCCRIGVTGTRRLRAAAVARIEERLREVFSAIAESVSAPGPCHPSGDPNAASSMRLITSLARGADRRAAEQAHALGISLFAVMPFPRDDYLLDFKGHEDPTEPALSPAEDKAEFAQLLAQAQNHWLELDGDRASDPDRGYESAGRFVVRHSDILIAVWDGQSAQGRGGTADIVHYAANAGVPVWWIHATEDWPSAWIADPLDISGPRPHAEPAEAALHAYLTSLFEAPATPHPDPHDWIGRLARIGQRDEYDALHAFLHESEPSPSVIWRVHGGLMRLASGLNPKSPPPEAPSRPDARYWFDRFAPADRRASAYASRYRSSYVWVFILGVAALIAGDIEPTLLLVHAGALGARISVIAEALAFALIVVFVGATIRNDWHERYIEYRLLAELCRAQQALTHVGYTIANGQVRRMVADDRIVWVAWLFAAWQRAAPLPTGVIGGSLRNEAPDAVCAFVEQQMTYYKDRAAISHAAERRFSQLGTLCFAGVLACVALRLAETWYQWPAAPATILELVAALLPGFSAAFVGFGAYAELQIVAEQSERMASALELATARLGRLRARQAERPLLSQDLGHEAAAISAFLLGELDGWAQLFRVKIIGTG
jgi:hypothetical protein